MTAIMYSEDSFKGYTIFQKKLLKALATVAKNKHIFLVT